MKSVVLTGLPGSGKTLTGTLLAQKFNVEFYDTDELIEKSEKKTVSEIFAQYGEEYFRRLEVKIVKSLPLENSVISLGGGTFENPEIRGLLLKNSVVVYLETTPETVYERIKSHTHRPLLSENIREKINQLLQIRGKNYKLATISLMTDNKTAEQIADEIFKCANLK